MLKQRVVIKWPFSSLFAREGIIISEMQYGESVVCKVLIERNLSNWIPRNWLEETGENQNPPNLTGVILNGQ
jgi:hypothetical protein